ncbi:MAG: ATPase, T2SS/T4P/T4SS family, partial [Clostridia bacterium]
PAPSELFGVCSSAADYGRMVVRNTLIISPPKCGKTTMLRDLARNLSNAGFRIGICDERSEIAGCYDGKTSYDLGPRTDVLDGCPKADGILMLIRAMSPDVVMTDEIGKPEDAAAIRSALSAGVKIITTIHGSSFEDAAKSAVGSLITDHVFETLIFLSAQPVTGTVEKILRMPEVSHG